MNEKKENAKEAETVSGPFFRPALTNAPISLRIGEKTILLFLYQEFLLGKKNVGFLKNWNSEFGKQGD